MNIHELIGGTKDKADHSGSAAKYTNIMKIKSESVVKDHTEIFVRSSHWFTITIINEYRGKGF